ncbi:MAG: nucleotidyltransferase domain-containing protein [Acidimicrobiaceae bacterium]|nr:nucleotidyltransferase domain-containing protein [Acidimicrobiaceae bacterium]MDE0318257.1 nucleotidyltransferase domain-containing protein [Acidimicrobiaceae bacterium]MDE0496787.1 nucleotidyltransferase domain-containing protein [Acidimicrobiaceae bacterium]
MSAPDLAAARRAAGELVAAGAGKVLLFGSLARGEATERSDIDLVAIYDDLDYAERGKRRCALEARGAAAAGCRVDVMVTDAPEWAVRTARVPCSVEARIAGYALELADAGDHGGIDWDKEIGLPSDSTAELQSRFTDMSDAIAALTNQMQPAPQEIAAADDVGERAALEDVRWARAMGELHMVVESAAKATHIVTTGSAPPHDHRIDALLAGQPEQVRDSFSQLAGDRVELSELHIWRPGATYSADRPHSRFDDASLRAHVTAALQIADFAADQCRHEGIADSALVRYERRRNHCRHILEGPLRHTDTSESDLEDQA